MNETAIQALEKIRTPQQLDKALREYWQIVAEHIAPIRMRIYRYKIPKMIVCKEGGLADCEYEFTEDEKKILAMADELDASVRRQLGLPEPPK